jgi:hypothetical protein
MKPNQVFISLMLAGGLTLVSQAQAQYVTGTQYLSNMDPSFPAPGAKYPSWATATVTTNATGLRVQSSGYGSGYYVIPGPQVQTINPSATQVRLQFTVGGTAADYNWVGTPFILNDDSGSYTYGGLYSGSGNPGDPATVVWSGNTATWTLPLQAAQLAKVQTGTDHIYSFNLQFDPAVLINGRSSYDVTFNSLSVVAIPEPGSLAMLALGAAGVLAFLRRN